MRRVEPEDASASPAPERRLGSGVGSFARLAATSALGSIVTVSWPLPAQAAPPDPADVLFSEGVAAMEAKRFEEGCPKLDKSYRLYPRPGTLFALADCEAGWGRIATAVKHYDEYLALYATLPADKRAKQGTRQQESLQQKAALERQVPQLTLAASHDLPPGSVVKCDGEVVPETALGHAISVDPGEHLVSVQAPGGPGKEVHVTLARGEKKPLDLSIETASAPTAPPATAIVEAPPPSQPGDKEGLPARKVGAFIAGGVGVAGILVGAITGGLAIGQKGIVKTNCQGLACDQTGFDAVHRLRSFGLVSTIGFGVGIAGVGAGAVLLLTGSSRPGSAPPKSARWANAVSLSAQRTGGAISLRGEW